MSKSDSAFWMGLALLVSLAGVLQWFVSEQNLQRSYISVQTILVGGLLLVTAFYAKRTSEIAKETKNLAEVTKQAVDEARRQRQDTFLPVLDIIVVSKADELVAIGVRLMAREVPNGLTCMIKNVGVGPALNVQWSNGIRMLTENSLIQGCEITPPGKLAIVSSANPPYIQVTYRDVFGRKCTSTKVICADFEQGTFELGPLKFCVQ